MIKQLRLFSTLLLLAVASMAWSEEVTTEKTTNELVSEYNWAVSAGTEMNGLYTEFNLDDNIVISTTGNPNCGSIWGTTTNDWRLYQNQKGNVIVTAIKGATLKSVTFTYSTTNGGVLKDSEANYVSSNVEKTISGTSATFTVGNTGDKTNGQVRITKFVVVYEITAGDVREATTTTIDASGITNTDVYTSTAAGQLTASVSTESGIIDGAMVTWSGDNDEVATIATDGTVTLVSAGTVKFTASYEGEAGLYWGSSDSYELKVINNDPNGPGTENNPYTVAQARAAIDAGTGMESVYVKGIVSQVDSYNSSYGSITYWISEDGTTTDQFEVYGGLNLNEQRFESIDDIALGSQVVIYGNIKKYNDIYEFDKNNYLVSIVAPEVTVEAPVFSPEGGEYTEAQSVTLACETEGASIYYTTDGTEPTNENTLYTAAISVEESMTIKAIAYVTSGAHSRVVTAVYEIKDVNAPGASEENPYTVAQARAAIDAGTGVTGVYAKGIVSKIVTAYSSQYGNITYNISDDGTETAVQLQAYRGKSYNGEDFASEEDIKVGDVVVIYGNLTKYNSTYEFAADNQLVSLTRPEQKETPEIKFLNEGGEAVTKVTLHVGESTTLTVQPEDLEMTFTNSDETVAKWENGTVTALANGTTTITANFAGNDTYNAATATLTVVVKEQQPVVEGKSFVKVTSKSELTDGNYLIVYETDGLAFNGGLETLDAIGNTIGVDIVENTIAANDANKAAVFTLASTDEGYTLLSASGLYIGQTSDVNGLVAKEEALYNTISFGEEGEANIVSGGAYLRYNAASNQTRFRYYKSSSYTSQKAVYLYKLTDQEPIASKVDPELSFETTAFNVEPNAEFTAPVLVNPYEVTVAYSTSDAEIAAVNETTGAVTIGEKEGTATITASFEGDETYKAATASYTITVKAAVDPGTDKYELVTDATTLKAGDEILIAYVDDEGATATVMGEQKSNNRAGVEATLNADMTITPTDAQVITLEGETDAWYFNVGDGYLYAASNEKNYLKTETEADDNAKATIAIAKNETTEAVEATIQFQGSNTRNLMRFNPNNGSPIFACYSATSGTGSLPQLYRKVAESENKKGDVNNDGSVTIADVTALVNIILGKSENYDSKVADVNEDGSITIADVTSLVNIILGKTN